MQKSFALLPESASTTSGRIDQLFFFLVIVSLFFASLICVLIIAFAIKYRKRRDGQVGAAIEGSIKLEMFWTTVPFMIAMVFFGWGAKLYFVEARPPEGVMDVYVVAKQWMWKLQHPTGQREINELHVPANQAIRLTMDSEDVIHSFYVPAFRLKRDVLPGRTTTAWFEATKPGDYHLFCAEYCGTKHSGMIGWVHVLEQRAYEDWLAGVQAADTPVEAGKKLFAQLRCDTCHNETSGARGPSLAGKFGLPVKLKGGLTVDFDDDYVRESVLKPLAKVVDGFEPLMPTYEGQVNAEQMMQIIAYLKSMQAAKQ
ncbi:MAG: cytochrome c oxidase subunit II [Planctomycetota bacterium]